MEPSYAIRSITEQILDEFLELLSQDGEIPSSLIEDLRQLANNRKMIYSEEILGAITSSTGGEP